MKIYLVLQHFGARFAVSSPGIRIGHSEEDRIHDAGCQCLLVRQETYKTRAEAQQRALDLMKQRPDDWCWPVEVESPE